MLKILVLYYSGVGNTKYVANQVYSILSKKSKEVEKSKKFSIEIHSIEKVPLSLEIDAYDALIIGFPTIHSAPAQPILNFMKILMQLKKETPTFLFTTCGLYAANSLRIFAEKCIPLNMIPILSKSYRCSATDGMLLAPFMKFWFKNEKHLLPKLERDALNFIEKIGDPVQLDMPKEAPYSILNYPNKWLGQKGVFSIYLHKNLCAKCYKCVNDCPVKAFDKDEENFPLLQKSKCINCYRCIHHCPEGALSLSKKYPPKKRWSLVEE